VLANKVERSKLENWPMWCGAVDPAQTHPADEHVLCVMKQCVFTQTKSRIECRFPTPHEVRQK